MEVFIEYLQQGFMFIVSLVILLGLLIFVHELGHFLVAKYFGVRVEVFSLGFGKKLLKKRFGDTDYCISLIPFGGYVKMYGDDPTAEVPEGDKASAFNYKPVWQRIAVVLAGPLMNFFFAIFLFSAIAMIGEETISPILGDVPQNSFAYESGFRSGDKILSADGIEVKAWEDLQRIIESSANKILTLSVLHSRDKSPVNISVQPTLGPNKNVLSTDEFVGEIEGFSFASSSSSIGVLSDQSAAYKAGLKSGDQIISVNGTPVERFEEVLEQIDQSEGDSITLSIKPQEKNQPTYSIELSKSKSSAQELLASFGISRSDLFISKVMPESAADKAGLKSGDKIVSINEVPASSWYDVIQKVQSFKEGQKPFDVSILRNGESLNLEIAPQLTTQSSPTGKKQEVYALGVVTAMTLATPHTFIERTSNPFKAFSHGITKSLYWTKATIMSFLRLVQNKVSAKSIGGPIMIGQLASKTFQIGISPFLKIMSIISINLFVLNLLPVPILDGGHLVFYIIEAIKGTPLSMRKMEIAQQVGLFILMALMVFAIFNDVTRLFQ